MGVSEKEDERKFVHVLEFVLNLDKMQTISTLMHKKCEIRKQSILKVIQAFHTVRLVLYIGCYYPVIGSSTALY